MVTLMDSRPTEQAQIQTSAGMAGQEGAQSVANMAPDVIKEVARQFILQYYTVCSKCPENLHRFYKEDSYMVRGTATVSGQVKIHEMFMSLDLKDSRASVLQLDALKAYKTSVLIQVTGEISIGGSEMRRYMQSFVLVESSPSNFYVLNDIFCYQDEVYGDARPNGDDGNAVDNTINNQGHVHETYEASFESAGETVTVESHLKANGDVTIMTTLPQQEEPLYQPLEPVEPEYTHDPVATDMNGQSDEYEEEPEQQAVEHVTVVEKVEDVLPVDPKPSEIAAPQPVVSNAPKTWVNILVGNTPAAPAPSAQVTLPSQGQRPPRQRAAPRPAGPSSEQRPPRNRPASPSEAQRSNNQAAANARSRALPDDCQVFVGNVPKACTESELREFFETYGSVVDVRITQSRTGRGNLPNFGFVVFDCPETAKDVIEKKSVYMKNGSHRLNVEEKHANKEGGRSGGNFSRGGGGGYGGGRGGGGGGPRRF